MSALHRIEFLQIENDTAKIKIFAVHPDAQRFPSSKDYLLQIIISYWSDLREGYDFNFFNLDLTKGEMRKRAENFARKDEFEKWFVLLRGKKIEITEKDFDALSLREIRHDPPEEDLERVEKNKRKLSEKLGGKIVSVFKRRENFDAPMIFGVTLAPDSQKFIEIADRIIVARTIGKSRTFKNFSKVTQSYGFAEITLQVSDAAYLTHIEENSSFETANVAFIKE